jgi:hypothetical protein
MAKTSKASTSGVQVALGHFPLADPETAAVRRAALEDLRADGLSEESLEEIAGLWHREDEHSRKRRHTPRWCALWSRQSRV